MHEIRQASKLSAIINGYCYILTRSETEKESRARERIYMFKGITHWAERSGTGKEWMAFFHRFRFLWLE